MLDLQLWNLVAGKSYHYTYRLWNFYPNQGRIQTFEKGGTARCVIIVDVGVTGICTVIVHKAHGHAKHANSKGSGSMPPRKLWKITLSGIESEGIFSDLSPFNAPMDTSIQNVLKINVAITCMPISKQLFNYCLFKYLCYYPLYLLMPLLMLYWR